MPVYALGYDQCMYMYVYPSVHIHISIVFLNTNNPPPYPQIPSFNIGNTLLKSTDTPKKSAPAFIMLLPPIPQLPTFSEIQNGPSFPQNGLIQQPFVLPTLPCTHYPFPLPDFPK